MSTRSKRTTPRKSKAVGDLAKVVEMAQALTIAGAASQAGGYAGAKAGKRIGRALGSRRTGKKVGRYVGRAAGAYLPRLMGMGAYEVGVPNDNLRMDVAQDSMTVVRSEYITDVYSGTGTPSAFNIDTYAVNPALDTNNGGTFTWLPQIARAFEEYKFEQLVFEYRPTSGSATGADTSVGEVIIAGQYRNASDDYVNKQQMLNSMFATSAAPYQKQMFPVELAQQSRPFQWHNCRDSNLPANSDLDLADTIKLSVATQGCPTASQNLGSLYVHYTVKFQKPTVDTSDSNIQAATAFIAGAADIVSEASPFSSSVNNVQTVSGNTFTLELITSSASTGRVRVPKSFGPEKSLWSLTVGYKGASTANTVFVLGTHNGFSAYNSYFAANQLDGGGSATAFDDWSNTGATSAVLMYTGVFQFDGVSDGSQPYIELAFGSATIPASATDCWVSLQQLNTSAWDNPLV